MADPTASPRVGVVALCGRPNVGKSTLLNALVGQPVAVATPHPQTTRERMLGLWAGDDFQVALVDTPGIHRARSELNQYMVREAARSIQGVDVVLLLAEAPRFKDDAQAAEWAPGEMQREALRVVTSSGRPVVLVLTKLDQQLRPEHLLPVLQAWSALHEFAAVVPTSAVTGEGIEQLSHEIVSRLKRGEALFDDEHLTDRPMRWHAAEIVRGELFKRLRQELPYSCAVTVETYRESSKGARVRAVIHVERESQKGMVIGKGGQGIAAIREGATAALVELTGAPVDLGLRVVVTPNWTQTPQLLRELGYIDPKPGPDADDASAAAPAVEPDHD